MSSNSDLKTPEEDEMASILGNWSRSLGFLCFSIVCLVETKDVVVVVVVVVFGFYILLLFTCWLILDVGFAVCSLVEWCLLLGFGWWSGSPE